MLGCGAFDCVTGTSSHRESVSGSGSGGEKDPGVTDVVPDGANTSAGHGSAVFEEGVGNEAGVFEGMDGALPRPGFEVVDVGWVEFNQVNRCALAS